MITGHTYQTYISKVRTLRTYAFYSLDLSILCYLQHGYIKLTFFYNMDPLNLCCLQSGPIKLMLCSEWKHQTYDVYSMTIFLYDKTNTITLLTVWTHPTFCTTIYQKQYYKCYCNILFTVLSVCPINTSYTQIIYKTSNKNWICQHCYVVLNITLNTLPLLLAKCNYNSSITATYEQYST
jgi:hypothetical protein